MSRELTQEEKDQIVKHALDIGIMEVVLESQLKNSDDEVIESTPFSVGVIFNKEIISEKEVEMLLKNGKWKDDPHILVTDLERLKNIFPHLKMEDKNGKEQIH